MCVYLVHTKIAVPTRVSSTRVEPGGSGSDATVVPLRVLMFSQVLNESVESLVMF